MTFWQQFRGTSFCNCSGTDTIVAVIPGRTLLQIADGRVPGCWCSWAMHTNADSAGEQNQSAQQDMHPS